MTRIESNTFAAACVDQNSIVDLREALADKEPMKADMEAWGITETEWRENIELAIAYMEEMASDE